MRPSIFVEISNDEYQMPNKYQMIKISNAANICHLILDIYLSFATWHLTFLLKKTRGSELFL